MKLKEFLTEEKWKQDRRVVQMMQDLAGSGIFVPGEVKMALEVTDEEKKGTNLPVPYGMIDKTGLVIGEMIMFEDEERGKTILTIQLDVPEIAIFDLDGNDTQSFKDIMDQTLEIFMRYFLKDGRTMSKALVDRIKDGDGYVVDFRITFLGNAKLKDLKGIL